MVFKRPTSNSEQEKIYPSCAMATAARSQDNPQTPGSTHARGYLRSARMFALNATLTVTVALAMLVPAYGQQEVDPTWYDPWAAPNQAIPQHLQPRAASRKNEGRLDQDQLQNASARSNYVRKHLVVIIRPTKLPQGDHIDSKTGEGPGVARNPVP
jgi:hypothetical protein